MGWLHFSCYIQGRNTLGKERGDIHETGEINGAYILNYTTNENIVPIFGSSSGLKQNGIPESVALGNFVLIATSDCALVGTGVFVQSSYRRQFFV